MFLPRGGGVALYIRNSLEAQVLNQDKENNAESIWVRIMDTNSKGIIIGACYRPPVAKWLLIKTRCRGDAVQKQSHVKTVIQFGKCSFYFNRNPGLTTKQ